MKLKILTHWVGLGALTALALGVVFTTGLTERADAQAAELDVLHVRGPIYMIAGAGGNTTASVGLDGTLLVDTGLAGRSDDILEVIQSLANLLSIQPAERASYGRFGADSRSSLELIMETNAPPKPIRWVLNTHRHGDHTGGNGALARAGATISAGNILGSVRDVIETASIVAHENVLLRMSNGFGDSPETEVDLELWPTETYIGEYYKLPYFNGEGVQMIHQPNAHTDGDSMVWFRRSDVISTGDIFTQTSYPIVDLDSGGSIQGIIDSLNYILDLGFAEFRLEGGTIIIPGHGRMSDLGDVGYYRDMTTILRDRIADAINRGLTLEQTQSEGLTSDYDVRWGGGSNAFWTTEDFVEAVYTDLTSN